MSPQERNTDLLEEVSLPEREFSPRFANAPRGLLSTLWDLGERKFRTAKATSIKDECPDHLLAIEASKLQGEGMLLGRSFSSLREYRQNSGRMPLAFLR